MSWLAVKEFFNPVLKTGHPVSFSVFADSFFLDLHSLFF